MNHGTGTAVVTIATGKYASYLPAFTTSVLEKFMPGTRVDVIAFTDAPTAPVGCRTIPLARADWPMSTLLRFRHFCAARPQLAGYDRLFYVDADMQVVRPIPVDDLAEPLYGVLHPAFVDGRGRGTFETNPASLAALPAGHDGPYFQGCLFGGSAVRFWDLCTVLRDRVEDDLRRGVIAVWHDESHLNWYFAQHRPMVLPPSFAFPQGWDVPYEPTIMHLAKDNDAMRAPPPPPPRGAIGRVVSLFARPRVES